MSQDCPGRFFSAVGSQQPDERKATTTTAQFEYDADDVSIDPRSTLAWK
jgi:hypothetical protein